MIFNGEEVAFPAVLQISFFKVIEKLEEMSHSEDEDAVIYAKALLAEVARYPALKDGVADIAELKKYDKSVKKLSRLLFPEVLGTNEIKTLTPPFHFEPIYSSTRFNSIVAASGGPLSLDMKDIDADTFYFYCCYFILASYYGYQTPAGAPWKIEIFNKNQNITRTYKMLINADMSDFIPTDKAVNITKEDYKELLNNFDDIDFWKTKFPPNSWLMRGLNIVNFVDVTLDESINTITSNLLVKSDDLFEKIQGGIRSLLNKNDLRVGVLMFEKQKLVAFDKENMHSILLKAGESLDCKSGMCNYTFDQLLDRKKPLVITDVKQYHNKTNSLLSEKLAQSEYNSYIIAPLIHEDELLGFMELGSKEAYFLNKGSIGLLNEVLPILAMAQKRFMAETQNLIEAIIQQECTTIHSSVKWRFEEEAEKFMIKQFNQEHPVFKDIVFDNLYPLYGQMDIKGSSVRRNEAVSKDLVKQINAVKKVLNKAFDKTEMPAYEALIFRIESFKKELQDGLSAGSEHKILAFLKSDVYPVFDHLKDSDLEIDSLLDEYNDLLDQDLKTVYEERKHYDTSVNLINQRLSAYLDEKQLDAQGMFPHYFERYKTDGVEFNMYIGQSIVKEEKFHKIYLKNLRIWQLGVMCEMENVFSSLQEELNTNIEIASLILVYNTSLSVHFRMDEKKFDVEGAYNARYEIIKKRVDKANIKGTDERITQPGKIAIIYSQEQDALEYREYLAFLAAKGYIKEEVEDHMLEDLQGVSGLKALRAVVNYNSGLNVDELMKEIEQKNSSINVN